MAKRIEDYALIGDCETAALVANDGSIDWLCMPRFDSSACFAALLGETKNGSWQLRPKDRVKSVARHYEPDTLVLVTEFVTASGAVQVIDCMPPRDQLPDIVRQVRCSQGCVAMTMALAPRFEYGAILPWLKMNEKCMTAIAGPDALYLKSDLALQATNYTVHSDFSIHEGEVVNFVLTWHPSNKSVGRPIDPQLLLEKTRNFWRSWTAAGSYRGFRETLVKRSLIVLKALTYAPTGGIVAAATTSLPENLGGTRNWDYRYCWLRDATLALYSLMVAGYRDEAKAWREWLLRAVAGSPAQIQIMYGLAGERRLTEYEVPWLAGYEKSQPVRIGNAAHSQLQLDVFGEVMDAMHLARRVGLKSFEAGWEMQKALMDYLESTWAKPDRGLWEVRGPDQHFTHSKVMAWVAFDRAVKGIEQFNLNGPIAKWRAIRDQIHKEVCERGFNLKLNSFTQTYGSQLLDASLLLLPLVGFLPPDDGRMRGTVQAIENSLMVDGFVRRYESASTVDGLPPGEGAFLACTFWLADNFVLQGRRADAKTVFERVAALCNDVGLLSEEYDLDQKRLIGNFPQAFSHIGLINTARSIAGESGPAEDRPNT